MDRDLARMEKAVEMRHNRHVLNINPRKRLEETRMHLFPIVVRCGEVMEH